MLEVHLEHAANEFVGDATAALRATGQPEVRWWFTSRIARLEAAVRAAIEAEDLRRSSSCRRTVFGEKPTTDGADFYLAGVPLVNYLTAPFYLFDAMDTLDKIHRPSLVPLTRAAIRIIESTRGVSARDARRLSAPSAGVAHGAQRDRLRRTTSVRPLPSPCTRALRRACRRASAMPNPRSRRSSPRGRALSR